MKFTREQTEGLYIIHACDAGEVVLNSPNPADGRDEDGRITLEQSFILSPQQLQREWAPCSMEEIGRAELEPVAALEPELLLLGTGKSMRFPENELLAALIELGIGYEVMGSAAACRTYNILAGEGRRVAAAIIIES